MFSNQENRSCFLKFGTPTHHNQQPLSQKISSNQLLPKNSTPNYRYAAQGHYQSSNQVNTKWFSSNLNATDKSFETRPNKSYTFSMLAKNKNSHGNQEQSTSPFSQKPSPRYEFKLPKRFSRQEPSKPETGDFSSQQSGSNIKPDILKLKIEGNKTDQNGQTASVLHDGKSIDHKFQKIDQELVDDKQSRIDKLEKQLKAAQETILRQAKQMTQVQEDNSKKDQEINELRNKIDKYENASKMLSSSNGFSITIPPLKQVGSEQQKKVEIQGHEKTKKERDHYRQLLKKQDCELIGAANINSSLAFQVNKYAQIIEEYNQHISILQLRELQYRLLYQQPSEQ